VCWLGTFSIGDTETYFAAGWGGWFIFVLPEPEVVVITTGGFEDRNYDALLHVVNWHVLPAAGRWRCRGKGTWRVSGEC
jgi:hypothetical protein